MAELNKNLAGEVILDTAKLSGFVIATDNDYDKTREIVRDVYGDNYGIEKLK